MLRRSGHFLTGVLVGLLAAGAVLLLTAKPRGAPILLFPPPSPSPLRIHVAGEVLKPGVYELPVNAIVDDAIQMAGGPTAEADLTAVNLAAPLVDGQRILLPRRGDEGVQAEANQLSGSGVSDGAIAVNTASAAELEKLPGIGPVLAQKIVEYREAHGPFARVEDLLEVAGIGPSTLEAIRDLIRVP